MVLQERLGKIPQYVETRRKAEEVGRLQDFDTLCSTMNPDVYSGLIKWPTYAGGNEFIYIGENGYAFQEMPRYGEQSDKQPSTLQQQPDAA